MHGALSSTMRPGLPPPLCQCRVPDRTQPFICLAYLLMCWLFALRRNGRLLHNDTFAGCRRDGEYIDSKNKWGMEAKFTAQPDCIDMPHHAIQHQGYAWLASMLCIAYTFYNLNYMSEILEGWGLHWSLLIHHDVVAQVPWSKIAFFMISLEISHLELWLAISSSHRSWRLYASWGLRYLASCFATALYVVWGEAGVQGVIRQGVYPSSNECQIPAGVTWHSWSGWSVQLPKANPASKQVSDPACSLGWKKAVVRSSLLGEENVNVNIYIYVCIAFQMFICWHINKHLYICIDDQTHFLFRTYIYI